MGNFATDETARSLVFDADANQSGPQAARSLAQRLAATGLIVRIAELPDGHDPNSYFTAGATAADFASCLEHAQGVYS